jgi:hypothetical protein
MTKSTLIFSDTEEAFYSASDKNVSLDFNSVSKQFSSSAPDLGLLPPVVRYISPWLIDHSNNDNGRHYAFAIVEQPPSMKTISFHSTSHDDCDPDDECEHCFNEDYPLAKTINIPVPWNYWVFHFTPSSDNHPIFSGHVNLFFAHSQAHDLDNPLYPPFVPNISPVSWYKNDIIDSILSSCTVCIGSDFWATKINNFSFANYLKFPLGIDDISFDQLFRDYVSFFWSTTFNSDYSDHLYNFLELIVDSKNDIPNDVHGWFPFLAQMSIDEVLTRLKKHSTSMYSLGDVINAFDSCIPPINLRAIFAKLSI